MIPGWVKWVRALTHMSHALTWIGGWSFGKRATQVGHRARETGVRLPRSLGRASRHALEFPVGPIFPPRHGAEPRKTDSSQSLFGCVVQVALVEHRSELLG